MKNKRLLAVLAAMFALVVAVLLFGNNDKEAGKLSKGDEKIKIGILQFVTHDALDEINKGIVDGLADAGYSAGDVIELQQMNAEADQSKIQTMSKQLVEKNDLVVGIATPAAQGLAAASSDIPVVMSAISDPIGAKLVKNLEKPDANVTGTSNQVPIKQTVELIRELTPDVKTVGVLYSSNEDNSVSQVEEFKTYAKELGLSVVEYAVPSTNEITTTMSVAVGAVDAIFVPQDNTIASAFPTVIKASNEAKLPVYSSVDTMVSQGSIGAIAQSQYDLGIETAKVIVKLLAGKKIADVPVTVIDTGVPMVNTDAADLLGIMIPDSLLEKAQTAKTIEK